MLAGHLKGLLGPDVDVVHLSGTHALLERPDDVRAAILAAGNARASTAL